jgi:ATP-dependent helicase HrpA
VAEAKKPKLLYLNKEMLMKQQVSLSEKLYPNSIKIADADLKLEYQFDPLHEDDGVSVNVPVAILRQVSRAQVDWIIPGLLREKILALIKSLPKSLRKNFVPAPDFADKVAEDLEYDGRELTVVLSEKLHRLTGVRVGKDSFGPEGIEPHLKLNIRVVDESGKVLGTGRNLSVLVDKFSRESARGFSQRNRHPIEESGLVDWSFGDLPSEIEIEQAGIRIKGYPALVDQGDSVSIKVMDNQVSAEHHNRKALLRLVMLQLPDQVRYVGKNIPGLQKFALFYATRGTASELLDYTVSAIFRYTFIEGKPIVDNELKFRDRLKEKQNLVETMNHVGRLLEIILQKSLLIEKQLKFNATDRNRNTYSDIRQQLERLLAPGFLATVPLRWLDQYPRYLKGIEYRMEKLQGNSARDEASLGELSAYSSRLFELDQPEAQALQQYRWMLEEFRVSLFAQPVGTSIPVSGKRLDKEWEKSFALAANK